MSEPATTPSASSSSPSGSRRQFIKTGVIAVGGAAALAAVGIPVLAPLVADKNKEVEKLEAQLNSANQQISSANQNVSALQSTLQTQTGFLTLSSQEQAAVEAIAETIIPTDSSGPGANEAGVVFFIDRQLAQDYGRSGNMFMQGPFVQAGQSSPITVNGVTYSAGSPNVRVGAGTRYQYYLNLREFWRVGLAALEAYSNQVYSGNFENLTSTQQSQVLQDLWNNIPTNFGEIVPEDFAYELFSMTWAGFLMDPLYGGNAGMVGWEYVGFNGTNTGNFYGEGHSDTEIMVSPTAIKLKPASLGQFQSALGLVPQPTTTPSSSPSSSPPSSSSTSTTSSSSSSSS